jgi:hypothetical protein
MQIGPGGTRPDSPIGGMSGGDPGRGGIPQIQGAARDLSLALADSNNTLLITLTPNDNDNYSSNVVYSVFWLDPTVFGIGDMYGNGTLGIVGVTGLSLIQGRKKVVDINGGSGVVSASVPYIPYTSGGWMYVVVIPTGATREYRLSGSNFVAVPVLGGGGAPLSGEVPTGFNVRAQNISTTNRLVQFSWRNAVTLSTVAYIKIAASNYLNDGSYREFVTFKVTTPPGAWQGFRQVGFLGDFIENSTGIVLEQDASLGAHTITWYCIPMTSGLVPLNLGACPNVGTSEI